MFTLKGLSMFVGDDKQAVRQFSQKQISHLVIEGIEYTQGTSTFVEFLIEYFINCICITKNIIL